MKLFVPTIGTRLRLTADWSFSLHGERRNYDLLEAVGAPKLRERDDFMKRYYTYDQELVHPTTLPKDTVLVVDRIYIRRGVGDFDSMTFRVLASPDPRLSAEPWRGYVKGTKRFWVKLHDANKIEFEPVPETWVQPKAIGRVRVRALSTPRSASL